jgi:signal peptidase II
VSPKVKHTKQVKLAFLGYFFIFIGIVLLDLLTKFWAEKSYLTSFSLKNIRDYNYISDFIFRIGSSTNWIEFETTYLRNTGAAWGFLGNLPENIRPYLFYVVTVVAMIIIFIFFLKTPSKQVLSRLAILFIFSGAAGNFLDRVLLHYVIDWINFKWNLFGWYYDYPVFNIADSVVTIGAVLLVIDTVKEDIKIRKARKSSKS